MPAPSSKLMLLPPALSRRALVLALSASTVPRPKPSHAATDGLAQLRAAQQTLARVDGLLPERSSWLDAQRLLNTLDDGVLTKALESSTDPASLKVCPGTAYPRLWVRHCRTQHTEPP